MGRAHAICSSAMRRGHGMARLLTITALLLSGCSSSTASTDDDSTGSGTTTSDGHATTDTPPYGEPSPCASSEECEEGQSCVAPYDPGEGGPGPAVCVEGCIEEENDLDRWCIDDLSCCGDLRCSVVDGFCEPPVDDGSTDSGSSATDTTASGSSATDTTGTGSSQTFTVSETATGSQGTTSGS